MPLPINPDEIEDREVLRQLLRTPGFREPYYHAVQARLDLLTARADLQEARHEAAVQKLRAQWNAKGHLPKKRGMPDGRSLKHATQNAGISGGGIVVVWATVKSATEAYKQIKSSGLGADAVAVLKALNPSEAQISVAVALAVLAFGVTLVVKAGKTF